MSTDATRAAVQGVVAAGGGPVTSSMGRLFDAVGALVTGRTVATYEAQTSIELEALARRIDRTATSPWPDAMPIDRSGGLPLLDPRQLVVEVVAAVRAGQAAEIVAARIHETIGSAAAALVLEVADRNGLDTVVLTGGVFQNARLTDVVEGALTHAGVEVLLHRTVPANDGGISLGQAAVAAARL